MSISRAAIFRSTQNAEPASAGIVSTIAHLLPASGPTYVTLTVSEVERDASSRQKPRTRKAAVTSGSGFIVDGTGYVMTAAHVAVHKGNSISARAANGRIYSGKVIGILPGNDMAIIKLRGYSGKAVTPSPPGVPRQGRPRSTRWASPMPKAIRRASGRLNRCISAVPSPMASSAIPMPWSCRWAPRRANPAARYLTANGRLIGMVVSTLSDGNGRSINLAHAIPATTLAGFLCSQTTCSSDWSALAAQSTDSCTSG